MEKPFIPTYNHHISGFPNTLQFPWRTSLCFYNGQYWFYAGVDSQGHHYMRCLIFMDEGCTYVPSEEPTDFRVLYGSELSNKLAQIEEFKRKYAL